MFVHVMFCSCLAHGSSCFPLMSCMLLISCYLMYLFTHVMLAHVMFGSCLAHISGIHSLWLGFFSLVAVLLYVNVTSSPDQVGNVGFGIVLTIWDF